MKQGLAHQMEVEETNLPADLVGEQVEFLCIQLSLFPGVLGTEVTVEITGVQFSRKKRNIVEWTVE